MLGLDPGTRVTGWGIVQRDRGGSHAVAFGCLKPRRGLDRTRQLVDLCGQLWSLLERFRPAVAAVETPFAGRFPRAVIGLAETRGALLATLGRWSDGLEVVEYEPATVKRTIVGYGAAEKQQIAYIVHRQLGLDEDPQSDAADALAIALCHLRHARLDV